MIKTVDSVKLLFKAQSEALAFSLVGNPGLTTRAYKQTMKLACAMVKNINYTSMAITMLNEGQKQHCEAIHDNQAATDYLLLLHHKGCHELNNMCCFN